MAVQQLHRQQFSCPTETPWRGSLSQHDQWERKHTGSPSTSLKQTCVLLGQIGSWDSCPQDCLGVGCAYHSMSMLAQNTDALCHSKCRADSFCFWSHIAVFYRTYGSNATNATSSCGRMCMTFVAPLLLCWNLIEITLCNTRSKINQC